MVQRYEQKRRLQWYKRGAAYKQKGEGWVKGGEGLAKPFTAIRVLYIAFYVILVKGEGCF